MHWPQLQPHYWIAYNGMVCCNVVTWLSCDMYHMTIMWHKYHMTVMGHVSHDYHVTYKYHMTIMWLVSALCTISCYLLCDCLVKAIVSEGALVVYVCYVWWALLHVASKRTKHHLIFLSLSWKLAKQLLNDQLCGSQSATVLCVVTWANTCSCSINWLQEISGS